MRIAPASRGEMEIVRRGVARYGADAGALLRGRTLLVAKNGRRVVSIAPREVVDTLKRMKHEPYSAGLAIGEIRRGEFRLGLEGAYLLAWRSRKYVKVNEKGEQLVLYGRDVFINSVVVQGDIEKGDPCFILNLRGEPLALGRVRMEDVFVENLRDRGMYLRKGE